MDGIKVVNKELEVIILMGVPGSGKTTFAWNFPEHIHINQDRLGNRNDCINAAKRALSHGKSIVIDRTNISRSQRKYFLDVAKDYGAKTFCIFLDFPAVECIERVKGRKEHETLPASTPESKIIEVVSKFNNNLELPQYYEGFIEIFHTVDFNDPDFIELVKNRLASEEAG